MRTGTSATLEQSQTEIRPPGIVDAIGVGYSRLLSRPYVILAPLMLDLYLWLGWRLTARSLTDQLAIWAADLDFGGSVVGFFEGQSDFNVVELASGQLPMVRLPTFTPLLSNDGAIRLSGWDPSLTLPAWWMTALVAIVLIVISFFIFAEYLLWLGSIIQDRTHTLNIRQSVQTAQALVLWVVLALLLILLIDGPLVAAQAAFRSTGADVSILLLFIMAIPIGVGFVYFFFSAYAIAIERTGALDGYRSSYRVVRRFGLQSIGFILAYLVVTSGFPLLWRVLLGPPAGVLIAFVGHAFIGSGMIAAAMVFYRDRAQLIAQIAEE